MSLAQLVNYLKDYELMGFFQAYEEARKRLEMDDLDRKKMVSLNHNYCIDKK